MLDEGKKLDLKLAGAYAMDSLRLEKGYRHWGHEIDSETSPVEARLMHAVDLNKVQFIVIIIHLPFMLCDRIYMVCVGHWLHLSASYL